MPEYTTHELCHALDRQNDLSLGREDLWYLAEGFVDYDYPTRKVRGEAFAYTCEIGPTSTYLVGESCPADTDGAEVFQFLFDVYVRPGPEHASREFVWTEVASALIERAGEEGFEVHVTVEETLRVALEGGSAAYVSPWTGDLVASLAPTLAAPTPTPEAPQSMTVQRWASEGSQEILLVRAEAPNGGVARRLVYRDQQGLTRQGCPRRREAPFIMNGEPWSAYADGDLVRWGRWAEL